MENLVIKSQATESANLISNGVEDICTRVASSMRKMIRDFPPLSPNCCIFRVPRRFKRIDEKPYIPHVVSIRPFHHGRKDLQPMEYLKPAYLDAFLKRSNMSLENCIQLVVEWEERIRDCYSERIEFSSDDFLKMILLDSCFIIEVICRRCLMPGDPPTDYLSHKSITKDVRRDMILLENQLPFFLLEGLFNLAFHSIAGVVGRDFVSVSLKYFQSFILTKDFERVLHHLRCQNVSEITHFLDLLRMCHAPSIRRPPQALSRQDTTMPRVVQLEEPGMVIEKRSDYHSVLDIRYKTGLLEIPRVIVSDKTSLLLKNLLALEFCHYRHDPYISHYIHFMDKLIDTERDVDLLIRNGVIQSLVSRSKEVASLFNNTRGPLFSKNDIYRDIRQNINAYCSISWHKWRATLRRDYCSSPWIIASTIAAATLLILTFIQSVCSIISVR